MATLRELIIKISANSQSFQSEIQRASRMGSEYTGPCRMADVRLLRQPGSSAGLWLSCTAS
ncbi:hypothetical protein [Escherichia coli]|uniref:hypothetical protein n=1 Tax=Escherichia coli TaxID=562 RepID=UPI0039A5BAEE